MARQMKTVVMRQEDHLLTVTVDPLKVARGQRLLPRGGVHASQRRPSRARARQQLRRQLLHTS